ncbi:hypothetical protein JTB14_032413 [Gonioctena quinquepunctata]|nr:hypothetical protein JTB14_032413 [Gonioctena quinquepunctata]
MAPAGDDAMYTAGVTITLEHSAGSICYSEWPSASLSLGAFISLEIPFSTLSANASKILTRGIPAGHRKDLPEKHCFLEGMSRVTLGIRVAQLAEEVCKNNARYNIRCASVRSVNGPRTEPEPPGDQQLLTTQSNEPANEVILIVDSDESENELAPIVEEHPENEVVPIADEKPVNYSIYVPFVEHSCPR